ncbi:SDR family oxidoreductase [Modicisalibacter tunisiensis]|uniref:SDR family oxidoreductase n=1 Tax=Modicisalibacter TaxID=574347 RepID=UPI0013D683CA|nr:MULTISPECIES: SDR family oxidoreductase [Modicisalibacter]MBZ9539669.1 SDR family oxidoreductase [Modicisalibacter tunisiensis]
MKNTSLILGCGDVGTALGRLLAAAGQRVVGVRRNPSALEGTGIEPLALDVTDAEALSAMPEADIVVYAASADRFEESAYQAAYPDGLKAVLGELEGRDRPPRHVFFVSSTGVYAQQDGETVDETSPTEPRGFSGQLMLAAERALLDSRLPGTVVRFSGIYGPGRDRLIRQVREGRVAPSVPSMYTNRIHRDDCAGVLAHLIERALTDQPLETLYLASDCEPVPLHDVTAWLARRLKIESTETMQSPLRRRSSKRCDNTRLCETGYRFRFPTFREGYAQVLAEADPAAPEKA